MANRSIARRLLGIPWPPILAALLVASLVVAFIVQWSAGTRHGKVPQELTILVSGDTNGLLFPCGCAAAQPGGLARRGEIVRQARTAGPVLYAELGGAPGGSSVYDQLKFSTILRGELAMGIAAHNIGPTEVALGVEELQRLARELKFPFVSTNVRDRGGRPLAEPLRLIETSGRRVAVLGLLSPQYGDDSLQVLDPADSIDAALAESTPKYDLLLVLAYLPSDELSTLAARLPAKAVLVGPNQASSIPNSNNAVAGLVGRQGQSLVRFDVTKDDRWSTSDVIVAAALPEDARQIDNLIAYHQELAKHDFSPAQTGLQMPLPPEVASTHRVAGTDACRACHAEDCAVWDISGHKRAWQSLVDRGVHYDAACQRCHTTGYGWPGGFDSVETSFETISVGCESCHGPSDAHRLDPANIRTPLVATEQCIQCHDADNSPGFDPASAWARIKHGSGRSALRIPETDSLRDLERIVN
jgi:hypothetical protein